MATGEPCTLSASTYVKIPLLMHGSGTACDLEDVPTISYGSVKCNDAYDGAFCMCHLLEVEPWPSSERETLRWM